MDKFANQPDRDRQAVLQEAAARRGDINPIILEKDFWVCWTLKRLVENTALAPHITFKGGTSLSKAYGLINRFSEDIDLTISRDAPYLSKGEDPMDDTISNKERERRIDALKENAQLFVTKIALPHLETDIRTEFGEKKEWKIVPDPEDKDQQTLLFYYPRVFNYTRGLNFSNFSFNKKNFATTEYIKPHIKLEFGARGETTPSHPQKISPYIAQDFPGLFTVHDLQVPTLDVERSFWEKVTILHALYHGMNMRDRMSRHYYDTYQMSEAGIAKAALGKIDLLEQVVRNKSLMFRDAKASYGTAKVGSIKLVPEPEAQARLKQDYKAMEEMFMGKYPDFDTVIKGLVELEKLINETMT